MSTLLELLKPWKQLWLTFWKKKKDSKTISEIREQKEFSFCKPVEEE